MINSVRTIYSLMKETVTAFGNRYNPDSEITINKIMDLPNVDIEQDLTMNYFMLGLDPINDGETKKEIYSSIDILPVIPAPLFSVKKSIGLTIDDVNKYGLVKEKNVNGETYLFCFLKKLDSVTDEGKVYRAVYDKVNNKYDIETFIFANQTLNNTPLRNPVDHYSNLDSFVAMSNYVTINLSETEIEDMKTAIDLYYGDNISLSNRRRITTVELVMGIENNGNKYNLQPSYFFTNELGIFDLNKSKDTFRVDIGGMTPLRTSM